MKAIADALSTLLYVALVLALAFLFVGEPSVWHKLHAVAEQVCR
jgi:hypothetical protein